MIDATYAYGFERLKGLLPPDTFGGFPDDYYSSGYNAGDGSAGLASKNYRLQGILSYEFMIANTQSGPYSWWESSTAPSATPWIGKHPAGGQGASPHAWGISQANKVLLDSLAAQESEGTLIVGRGVPPSWLGVHQPIVVANFPTIDGRRINLRISSSGDSVTLALTGQATKGLVHFELRSFVKNIASSTAGTIDQAPAR